MSYLCVKTYNLNNKGDKVQDKYLMNLEQSVWKDCLPAGVEGYTLLHTHKTRLHLQYVPVKKTAARRSH